MTRIPRLVIAAPASGAGKTTVATGLMAAFAQRGLAVSGHKVGPDYIDPGYHALATGRPGRNLDPWLTSEDLIAPLFLHGAQGADVAVIEGVMGLYDGAHGGPGGLVGRPFSGGTDGAADGAVHAGGPIEDGSFASTAHVAGLLEAPVVLVVDAASAGRSVAATVHGFRTFGAVRAGGAPGGAGGRPSSGDAVRLGGVILNRIGSDRHEEICRAAIEELGLPVLGVLRRRDDVTTPSRHLGLIPAAERRPAALATVERLAALIASCCDLDALMALAQTAPSMSAAPWDPNDPEPRDALALWQAAGSVSAARPGERAPVVAVAGGPAFTFGYAENEELLRAAGAEVVRFDPLHDESLPEGAAGLVIGGGFPELYVAELSENEPLRKQIAHLTTVPAREPPARGFPVYAECAGLLYLVRELDGAPMCGTLDATATMTPRLTLGYRTAVAISDSVVARTGERVYGHEFHHTVLSPGHADEAAAWQWAIRGGSRKDGFARRDLVASYLHLHWAGAPRFAGRFVEACRWPS